MNKKGLLKGAASSVAVLAMAAAFAGNTITIPNGTGSVDFQGEPGNVIVNQTAASTFLVGDQVTIISGTLVEQAGHTATWGEDAWIAISSPQHPGLIAFVQPSTAGDYTTSLTLTPGPVAMFGTLLGETITTGQGLSFEFFEGFDDGAAGQAEQVWNNLVFTIDPHLPTPPASENLGTITGNVSRTHNFGTAEVKWYKFTTTQPTDASTFLNISTGNTTAFLGGAFGDNDTEIAVYSQYGTWLYTNDDEDFDNDIFTSLITFGQNDPIYGDLAAGTYYLAVGGWNTTFNDGFDATSDSTASGPVVLDLTSNFGPSGTSVSGTITLQDLAVSSAGQSVEWEILSGGSVVDSGSATLGTGGTYTFSADGSLSGSYTVRVKGSTFLSKVSSAVTLGGSPVTGLNFSLLNGDVDGDNEVGLADFGLLSDAFGAVDGDPNYNSQADLDQDGEVGLSDFGILSNNFGEVGD